MRHNYRYGYSLIEMLIVVTIISIITLFAYSSFHTSILKTRRGDAMTALLRLATRQELFRLEHSRYAGATEYRLAPPAGLGISSTDADYYELDVQSADNGFLATATVRPDNKQQDDFRCWKFGIDATGRHWATNETGSDSTAVCWNS